MRILIALIYGLSLNLFGSAFSNPIQHGPIIHWNQDPSKSCQIVWLQRHGQIGIEDQWSIGAPGFGYNDSDDATIFDRMKNRYHSLAIRKTLANALPFPDNSQLILRIKYDDGFIAWINGKEILRQNISDNGLHAATRHESKAFEEFSLGSAKQLLNQTKTVFAIHGFNHEIQSSDFSLHPILIIKSGEQEWPLSLSNEPWEYLAHTQPEPGWQNTVSNLSSNDTPKSKWTFEHRVKGVKPWSKTQVQSAPFANSSHLVLRAELQSLPDGKEIEFRISHGANSSSPIFSFRMPPPKERPIRFVTGGDLYHAREPMDQMNRVAGSLDPLFALIGGDLAYANNGSFERWFDYIDSWAMNARCPDGRLIPKIVAIGNHEIVGAGYHPTDAPSPVAASMFYSIFKFPTHQKANHAVDFGNWLSIVNLDSGHTQNIADQNTWLDQTLKRRQHIPNLFVCYHRPAWGSGTKPDATDIQREWCPLFEKYRVTAVFENDHHVFSRSHPITDGRIDHQNGIPYLGSGSWSVTPRKLDPNELSKRPWIATADAINHLYLIETREHGYQASAINLNGQTFDQSNRTWHRNLKTHPAIKTSNTQAP